MKPTDKLKRDRVLITQHKAGYVARFQSRRRLFGWRTVIATRPAVTFQACLADAGRIMTQLQFGVAGRDIPRHERRRMARTMAGMFQ